MISHDVDEAIYLADKIVLMTNGPGAVVAEVVENPLPKERARADIHRHPLYYPVRNHIIDFLIARSRTFVHATPDYDPRKVAVIRPRGEPIAVSTNTASLPGNSPSETGVNALMTRQSIANS
jgi:nitrate/nitrite transport system ATP-binding protein